MQSSSEHVKDTHADPSGFKTTISNEELNQLQLKAFHEKVQVVTDPAALPAVAKEIQKHAVVGFDTETRPSFKRGQVFKVALIQLAIPGKVFLIRTHHAGVTPEIAAVFENPGIIKAGVAIHDDIKGLQKYAPFTPQSFVDLSIVARKAGYQVESVKKLTGLLLGFRISKSAQTSNWEAPTLTEKQIEYAATDAWVCLEIYRKLAETTGKGPVGQ